jgi:hypothetical protein
VIAYRSEQRDLCTADALDAIRRELGEIEGAADPRFEAVQNLLIRFGEFEAAAADALSPDLDSDTAELRVLRQASMAFGRLFYAAYRRRSCSELTERCARGLDAISALPLPEHLTASAAEGYAFYGLYPQTYLEAAEKCARELHPCDVVVIGIRGIGASLASVAAACFEDHGCRVRSHTVRPRGRPFNRVLLIGERLRAQWGSARSALFAVVDEGPGLSGSSFACVTALLRTIGVRDHCIALFPSWEANPAAFVNEDARGEWIRYRKFVAESASAPRPPGRDISAGSWRSLLFSSSSEYPAVQPQHERLKYLDDSGVLYKFAGLGQYGSAKLPLAERLAEEGFAPRPAGFQDGFIAYEFEAGRPLFARDVSDSLLDRIGSYLAFRKAKLPAERSVSFDAMLDLIRVNAEEGLGPAFSAPCEALSACRAEFESRPATAVDGRMAPHEWLETPRGFMKTDATDHHADHFFPGCADIAWDLAAAAVEFQLRREARDYLTNRYQQCSGDRPSGELLTFYRIAYLSFRLGYCSLAATSTAGSAEQERFKALQLGYASLLKQEFSSYTHRIRVSA